MMKRMALVFIIGLGLIILLGKSSVSAEDAPKPACPMKACFDKMDADKNGEVSETEFIENCKARFSAMDADKSGALKSEELKPCCMTQMPEKKACPFMKEGAGK